MRNVLNPGITYLDGIWPSGHKESWGGLLIVTGVFTKWEEVIFRVKRLWRWLPLSRDGILRQNVEVVRTNRKSNLSFNNCYDQENEKDPKQSLKPEVASGLGLPEPCGITIQTRIKQAKKDHKHIPHSLTCKEKFEKEKREKWVKRHKIKVIESAKEWASLGGCIKW